MSLPSRIETLYRRLTGVGRQVAALPYVKESEVGGVAVKYSAAPAAPVVGALAPW